MLVSSSVCTALSRKYNLPVDRKKVIFHFSVGSIFMKLFFLYIAALQLTILLLWNSIDTFLLLTTGDIHNCLLQAYKLGIFSFFDLPSWLCWPHFIDYKKELWLLPLVLQLEPPLNVLGKWFECPFLPSELINIACYWTVFILSEVTHLSTSDLLATHFLGFFT